MNEIFEKIYNNNNNTSLNEDTALFEKVYAEAEMLNEMNPKLRALLAAGLIGTAGLGAASCSMPTDDPYDVQYTIEQPTPENPEEIEEIEDSEDSEEIMDSEEIEDSEEIGDNGGEETVTEAQKQLNTLLEIIDYNGLREEMAGAKNISNKFSRVTDVMSIGYTAILFTKDGIDENIEEKLGKDAYTFAKGLTFYFILKADYPDLNPDAFLAALNI